MKILPDRQKTYFFLIFKAGREENRRNHRSESAEKGKWQTVRVLEEGPCRAMEKEGNACEFFDGIVNDFTKSLCKT